jgi:hypothetical protein
MRTGVLVGAVAALVLAAVSASDAGACSRRSAGCGSYGPPPVAYHYAPPPPAYGYAPPVPYGYLPPAPVYSWAPPRNVPAYGYRGAWPDCDRRNGYGSAGYGYGYRNGYGYAPPAAYDDYAPAAVWVR